MEEHFSQLHLCKKPRGGTAKHKASLAGILSNLDKCKLCKEKPAIKKLVRKSLLGQRSGACSLVLHLLKWLKHTLLEESTRIWLFSVAHSPHNSSASYTVTAGNDRLHSYLFL